MTDVIDLANPPDNIRLEGSAAARIAACFGIDAVLPVTIPVWVADYLENVSAGELVRLRSARCDGNSIDFADLKGGKQTLASQIFFRGDDYRSPDLMDMKDQYGNCKKYAQIVKRRES